MSLAVIQYQGYLKITLVFKGRLAIQIKLSVFKLYIQESHKNKTQTIKLYDSSFLHKCKKIESLSTPIQGERHVNNMCNVWIFISLICFYFLG